MYDPTDGLDGLNTKNIEGAFPTFRGRDARRVNFQPQIQSLRWILSIYSPSEIYRSAPRTEHQEIDSKHFGFYIRSWGEFIKTRERPTLYFHASNIVTWSWRLGRDKTRTVDRRNWLEVFLVFWAVNPRRKPRRRPRGPGEAVDAPPDRPPGPQTRMHTFWTQIIEPYNYRAVGWWVDGSMSWWCSVAGLIDWVDGLVSWWVELIGW